MTKAEQTQHFKALINELYPEIREFRETLHQYPELSWKEFETTERIVKKLQEHGVKNIQRPLETGAIVDFVYKENAPFVLFRADIDALPIQDEKTVSYHSKNNGVCHACGHDGHTSIVMAVLLALHKSEVQLPFNIRFVFQPAEEPSVSGAPEMIKAGALKNVKLALGMHLEPRLPLGTLGLASGYVNMRSDRVDIQLSGKGGHSARPAECADLLWIASRIIQDSYAMVYRGVDLRDSPVILTFTEINAGQGYNIIPKELSMVGTLRFADPSKQATFLKRFRPYLDALSAENDCKIDFRIKNGAAAIFNDIPLMESMRKNLDTFWLKAEANNEFRTPGGDDFSYYCQEVPGAMVRIGVRTEKTTASLHEGKFDIPAESLKIGAAFFLHQLTNMELT